MLTKPHIIYGWRLLWTEMKIILVDPLSFDSYPLLYISSWCRTVMLHFHYYLTQSYFWIIIIRLCSCSVWEAFPYLFRAYTSRKLVVWCLFTWLDIIWEKWISLFKFDAMDDIVTIRKCTNTNHNVLLLSFRIDKRRKSDRNYSHTSDVV